MRFRLSRSGAITLGVVVGMIVASVATAGAARLITGKQIKNGTISAKDLSKAVRDQLAKAGQPALPDVLPSGRTMTGLYGWAGHQTSGYSPVHVVTYPMPLSFTPQIQTIGIGGGSTANCPGTAKAPAAAAGYLCVYQLRNDKGTFLFVDNTGPSDVADPKLGFELFSNLLDNTDYQFNGSWAVKAP